MSQNNEEFSYNPMNPSYTFNGNNNIYHFMGPGRYDVNLRLSSSPRSNPNKKNVFETRTDTTTNVLFPNSSLSTVPASTAKTRATGSEQFQTVGASPSRTLSSSGVTGSSFPGIYMETPPHAMRNPTSGSGTPK